jgi:ATP-binding cassette subfamily B protein
LAFLVVTALLASASPWVLRSAVDDLTRRLTHEKLWTYALVIVALVAAEGLFRYGTRLTLIGMSREIEYELRQDLFSHLCRLAPAYYHTHRIGDLMSRATNDLAAVRMVLGPGIMYSANTAATFVTALALMAAISPRLLAVSLLPLFVVAWLVYRFGRLIHDRSEQVQAQLAHLSAVVQENLAGARVVRAYVQEPAEQRRFQGANDEYLRRSRRLIVLVGGLQPFVITLLGFGAVLVLWLGGSMVAAHTITLGDFVAFTVYLGMLHWPTRRGVDGTLPRGPRCACGDPERRRSHGLRCARRSRVSRPDLRIRRRSGSSSRHRSQRACRIHAGHRGADRFGEEHARRAPAPPARPGPGHALCRRP